MIRIAAVIFIAMAAGAASQQQDTRRPPSTPVASASSTTPGLNSEYLYNGVKRPAIITVNPPRSFGTVTLALMDFDGKLLAQPVEVHPGRVDLAEKLPAIWQLPRAAYLQLIDGEQPIGSALVIQPLLSRMVPVTRVDHRPNGGALYSRIVGWMDENDPAAQAPPAQPPAASAPAATMPSSPSSASPAQPAIPPEQTTDQSAKPDERKAKSQSVARLFTGLRIYPEQDVVLHTTKGDIRVAMKADEAPNTVWNFLELSRGGFYRDVEFHRVVKLDRNGLPFVIQGGDPTATGDGGPGYWLPIEESHLPHDLGVISMARSDDPDSNGSQFFFCLSREGTKRLDGQYCSFGYAVDGVQAIKAIAEVELADVEAGRPVDPPMIRSAELVPAPPRLPNRGRPDARITAESKPAEQIPGNRVPR